MLHIKTTNTTTIWISGPFATALDQIVSHLHFRAASILRMLILTLVGLLFVLVGLMILTGRAEVGGPIMGGVLLAGFGASQFARSGNARTPE